jgi:Putative amidoligase enzyme
MFKKGMKLNSRLCDDIGLNNYAVEFPDSYGVEVELEGKGVVTKKAAVMDYWTHHVDGSLRANGGEAIEYVFKYPLNFDSTKKAVDILFDHLTSPGVEVFESYRTSIHVHVNFGMETYRTIYNFMTLCLILDELLTSQNGDHRIGNNFCLRARDAEGQVTSLIHSITNGMEFHAMSGHERYSSINFVSLLKFGSIEFRSLECTTHKGRLMHWINTLGRLKDASKKFDDPRDIISQFSKMGWKTFLATVLGPYAVKYLTVPGAHEMLHHGMRLAQDLAFCSEWKVRDENEKPAKNPYLKKNLGLPPQGQQNWAGQQPPVAELLQAIPVPHWLEN